MKNLIKKMLEIGGRQVPVEAETEKTYWRRGA